MHITTRYFSPFVFAITFLALLPWEFASAAEQRQLLGSYRDWDALVITRDNGERVCYMISVPTQTAPNNVTRGDIYTMITHRPRAGIRNEVNVIVGYPFASGSDATVTIASRRFNLFTEADGAWLRTPQEDQNLVEAMRAGNAMVVNGRSSRGTNTTDRYSLLGFTAAHNAINEACAP